MKEKYNRLEVLEKKIVADNKGVTSTRALCKCDCGTVRWFRYYTLTSGKVKSCGCLTKEVGREMCQKRNYKHGCSKRGDRIARIYYSMLKRCYNSKDSSYKNYGARGIGVCDDWRNDITKFVKWAEKNGGRDKSLQLDRIDNDKDYSPENCRFITCAENLRNRRNTVLIDGMVAKDYFIQLSKETGINWRTIHSRYYKLKKYEIPITRENLIKSIDHRMYDKSC